MSARVVLNKAEFYITNVCNLTCNRCNRFNNYDFRGWQRWQDYQQHYKEWSLIVDIKNIVILGGEPLLNPTLSEWINGLGSLWPDADIQILTNGTRLGNIKGELLDIVQQRQAWIGVSWHEKDDVDLIKRSMLEIMQEPLTIISGKDNTGSRADYFFADAQGLGIDVWVQDEFSDATVIKSADGTLKLHDNDPELAHSKCSFVIHKCYHFSQGKLYKCGVMAVLPDFDRQHPLGISQDDRSLINDYRPLSPFQSTHEIQQFFQQLDQPIPQCKFCPTEFTIEKISPVRKGMI